MIAVASCWPPDVATGSGTTVSQNRLIEALGRVGLQAEIIYTSRFATTPSQLEARRTANAGLCLDGYAAVLGIDGEGWLWARERRVPYIACCEAVLAEVLPFEDEASVDILRAQAQWEAAAAHVADAVVARSSFAADRVAQQYGVARDRVSVLPIPFDVAAWRAALPPLPKEPLVLAVGHAYPRKNYRTLLDAWPAVAAACPEARLELIGAGPDWPVLSGLARMLPAVTLRGHVSYRELLSLYARAQVFCHPSLQENFGIAVVEGLAAGAAVVTHVQPAVIETLAGLPGTWALDARDPGPLANALIEALQAPAPWPPDRLAALAQRLDPASVGQQLRQLLSGCNDRWLMPRRLVSGCSVMSTPRRQRCCRQRYRRRSRLSRHRAIGASADIV